MIKLRRRYVRHATVAGVLAVALSACALPGLAKPIPFTPAPAVTPAPATPQVPRTVPATAAAPKQGCVYSYHRVDQLGTFGAAVGHDFNCALVYNNASPDWANWEKPWFTIHGDPNFNWAHGKIAVPGRRLIITQALIPSGMEGDWRARGAAGEYKGHARTLATNLVAAGLGDSIIRLAPEANGTWMVDGLGNDPAEYAHWKSFWAKTVWAMRSVPGANFRFDWTINASYRAIPFGQYYPGNDVVDIVGADVYDFWAGPAAAPASPSARWTAQYNEDGGLGDLIKWGKVHGKPLSIPEWGLSAVGHKGGVGDNPYFVNAIAAVVRENATAYQSYFESPTVVGRLLTDAPRSVAAYRQQFGS